MNETQALVWELAAACIRARLAENRASEAETRVRELEAKVEELTPKESDGKT